MKFLQQLLHTKAPNNTKLLNIAIVLSILPHLFVAKSFMLLYVTIASIFILKKSKKQFTLMFIGLILIALSFFTTYNFSDFSRIQFFVSLVSSLLIFAVTLQKLTNVVNVYLKVSPILLMVLSFFFYNSLFMLLYSVATLFLFTMLYIWSRMDATLLDVSRFTAKLFIASLPLVTILFLVFPRISIEKTDFGFRADTYLDSGYDGTMRVSSNAINLSNKIVMEVLFQDENISNSQLYFRGSTLNTQKGLEWLKNPNLNHQERLSGISNTIQYEVTIYPHAKNWVYSLDIPLSAPKKTTILSDYTLQSQKPLYAKKRYTIKSALIYKLFANNLSSHLYVDTTQSTTTYNALQDIHLQKISDTEKASALLAFFRHQKIAYTLKPTGTDLDNFTDSFLFESKNGYCVHFASAFAASARMIGIPSRIVTGFKADKKNMINNYLIVKASDAHAWVELYIRQKGWVRYDPTTTALIDLNQAQNTQNTNLLENSTFTKLNHYFLYAKYIINDWILYYDRAKQMEILKKILNDTLYLLKVIFGFLTLIVISAVLFYALRGESCKDSVMCAMQKLLKLLEKYKVSKSPHESMQSFLKKAQNNLQVDLQEINKCYHQLKYAKEYDKKTLSQLKEAIQKLQIHLAKKRSS